QHRLAAWALLPQPFGDIGRPLLGRTVVDTTDGRKDFVDPTHKTALCKKFNYSRYKVYVSEFIQSIPDRGDHLHGLCELLVAIALTRRQPGDPVNQCASHYNTVAHGGHFAGGLRILDAKAHHDWQLSHRTQVADALAN